MIYSTWKSHAFFSVLFNTEEKTALTYKNMPLTSFKIWKQGINRLLISVKLKDLHSIMQSWVFSSYCDEKEVLWKNQYEKGNEIGISSLKGNEIDESSLILRFEKMSSEKKFTCPLIKID